MMTCRCRTCPPSLNEWETHQAWLLAVIPDYLWQTNPETGKNWQKKRDYLTVVGDCGAVWQLKHTPTCSSNYSHIFTNTKRTYNRILHITRLWTYTAACSRLKPILLSFQMSLWHIPVRDKLSQRCTDLCHQHITLMHNWNSIHLLLFLLLLSPIHLPYPISSAFFTCLVNILHHCTVPHDWWYWPTLCTLWAA